MLKVYNKNKELVAYIDKYRDLSIESVLATGDSTLSFIYNLNYSYSNLLEEEGYIRTKDNEYVIKEINSSSDDLNIKCNLNVEELEGKAWEHFNTVTQTISDCLTLALAGTGWTIASSNITKKRTVKLTNCTSWKIIQEAKKVYKAEFKFDSINKKIYIYEKRGEDKGVYFMENLNLEAVDIQGNTYDFYTRIIPKGKDGLNIKSVNNGKEYLENHQYSNKVKTLIWSDERYTIAQSLKEDAEHKLNELSKPYRAYATVIRDLAKLNDKYKDILNYKLGDTITLISKSRKLKERQRIIKMLEYPQDPSRNTCELANATLTFEDIQQEMIEVADTVDNITTDNGTINSEAIESIKTEQIKDFSTEVAKITNLEAVNANIENLIANKADINSLNAVKANIGRLEATTAKITDLTAINAEIVNLQTTKAEITDLTATNVKVDILEGNVANVQTIIGGNISSENIQSEGITGDRLNMNTIFVKDANIETVNATKINGGEIDVNKVTIKSEDGAIEIAGATQQFRDKNNRVRIQMGKDTQGNFNFILKGEDGTTTLIDHIGIKEKAIADDLIKENMIDENAVGERQIDYTSFSKGFNKDTNTASIKATKVRLDNQNQTLDVAFTNLKTQSDDTKTQTESNTTSISIQQGQINTAISNTKIIKDGKEILLKDDYNTTVATVNSMKNTISSHTTKIDENTGKITNVESKANILERDLNSMSSKITDTEVIVNNHAAQIATIQDVSNNASNKADKNKADIVTVNTEITNTKSRISGIEQNLDSITSRVSNVESTTTTINNKVAAHESRIATAEQKITASAIINTVQNTITQAQNNAINTSNANTDSKLKNYATSSQLTQLKQDSEKFQFDVKSSGSKNYVMNGNFKGHKNNWVIFGSPVAFDINDTYGDGSDCYAQLQLNADNQGISQTVRGLTAGHVYTLSAKVSIDKGIGCGIQVKNGDVYTSEKIFAEGGKLIKTLSITFTAKENFIRVYLGRGSFGNSGISRWREVQVRQGSLVLPYVDNGNEVVTSKYTLDNNGLEAKFEDGTYAKMGREGFMYYSQGMSLPYRYINFTARVSRIKNGTWTNITLPACFKNKNINTDFVITAWAGAVDSNAFSSKQKDAIRNLFIEVGTWDKATRILKVRPCLQKIGVATHTHWGWDATTTTSGNTVGEGAIDIIVLAQM